MDIERLDILLTDVIMPGGVHRGELADAVRKVNPGTKVVFMSGYPDHELVAKGITDPQTNALHKPFDKDELKRRLEASLKGDGGPVGSK
jgi:YesN/AraC family two-component response regulator